jgi:hypothetical protein
MTSDPTSNAARIATPLPGRASRACGCARPRSSGAAQRMRPAAASHPTGTGGTGGVNTAPAPSALEAGRQPR